mgnify:FL=1
MDNRTSLPSPLLGEFPNLILHGFNICYNFSLLPIVLAVDTEKI